MNANSIPIVNKSHTQQFIFYKHIFAGHFFSNEWNATLTSKLREKKSSSCRNRVCTKTKMKPASWNQSPMNTMRPIWMRLEKQPDFFFCWIIFANKKIKREKWTQKNANKKFGGTFFSTIKIKYTRKCCNTWLIIREWGIRCVGMG